MYFSHMNVLAFSFCPVPKCKLLSERISTVEIKFFFYLVDGESVSIQAWQRWKVRIFHGNSQKDVSKLLWLAHHTLFFQLSPSNVHGCQTKRQTPLRGGGSMWGTSAASASLHLSTVVIVIPVMPCLFSTCPALCCCSGSFHLPVLTFPAGHGRWVTLPRAGCQCFPGHESLGTGSGSLDICI